MTRHCRTLLHQSNIFSQRALQTIYTPSARCIKSHCEFAKAPARRLWLERRTSKFLGVKVVATDAKVFNNVSDDAARHIARMPGKRNEPVGAKRI